MQTIYKNFQFEEAKQVGPEEDRVLHFIGTTSSEDRYGDVVKSRGGKLERYQANPVFLWCHDHNCPPIGKSVAINVGDNSIEFDVKFDTDDFSDKIYKKYQNGFMRAVSIGFLPLEKPERREVQHYLGAGSKGYEYNLWELLELSAVTVPGNGEALKNQWEERDAPEENSMDNELVAKAFQQMADTQTKLLSFVEASMKRSADVSDNQPYNNGTGAAGAGDAAPTGQEDKSMAALSGHLQRCMEGLMTVHAHVKDIHSAYCGNADPSADNPMAGSQTPSSDGPAETVVHQNSAPAYTVKGLDAVLDLSKLTLDSIIEL